MVRRLAQWLGAMVIAFGVLGIPLESPAQADSVKLRAAKKKKAKARAKKSKKETRSKKKKKSKTKSKSSKRSAAVVKRPMP